MNARRSSANRPADARRALIEADLMLAAGRFEPAMEAYAALRLVAVDSRVRARVECGLAEALCRLERGREARPHAAAAAALYDGLGSEPDALYAKYWLAYAHYQSTASSRHAHSSSLCWRGCAAA